MNALANWLVVAGYLVAVNLMTVFVFRLDKQRAMRREWRIPETHLLLLALAGGTPGAKFAQRKFRHKTRKQPFAGALDTIAAVQILITLAILFPGARDVLYALRAAAG